MTSKVVAVPMSTTMAVAVESVEGGDAVDDAVGADLGGVVGEDGQAGADAGLDEEGLDVEVEIGGTAQGGVERRDDGGDDDAGDVGDVDARRAKRSRKSMPNSSTVMLAVGGDAPVGEERGGGSGTASVSARR